jgi:hypothetical protein
MCNWDYHTRDFQIEYYRIIVLWLSFSNSHTFRQSITYEVQIAEIIQARCFLCVLTSTFVLEMISEPSERVFSVIDLTSMETINYQKNQ